jgi:hypothetical protein
VALGVPVPVALAEAAVVNAALAEGMVDAEASCVGATTDAAADEAADAATEPDAAMETDGSIDVVGVGVADAASD